MNVRAAAAGWIVAFAAVDLQRFDVSASSSSSSSSSSVDAPCEGPRHTGVSRCLASAQRDILCCIIDSMDKSKFRLLFVPEAKCW